MLNDRLPLPDPDTLSDPHELAVVDGDPVTLPDARDVALPDTDCDDDADVQPLDEPVSVTDTDDVADTEGD